MTEAQLKKGINLRTKIDRLNDCIGKLQSFENQFNDKKDEEEIDFNLKLTIGNSYKDIIFYYQEVEFVRQFLESLVKNSVKELNKLEEKFKKL